MSPRRWLDWTLLVVPGTIWGASFLFIAEGLEAMAPNGITFMRIAIGFACLSLVPAARRPLASGDGWPTALLGFLWLALPLSLLPVRGTTRVVGPHRDVERRDPYHHRDRRVAGRAAVAGDGRLSVGLVVGVAGTVADCRPDLDGSSSAAGVALIVAAIVLYGVALNLARPLQQRSGALPVVWRALGVAALLTAPLGVPAVLDAHWTPRALLSMLALGALGTCAANVLMTMAAGRFGATRASATLFLIPIVALVLGVVLRGEDVAPLSVAGAAVCLAGAWLIRRPAVPAAEPRLQPVAAQRLIVADTTITVPVRDC